MTGIAAIHHPLRDIDPRARYIRPVVNIPDLVDRTAVRAHSQPQTRIVFQQPADFQRTLHRLLRTFEKDQRHPIAGRNGNEFSPRVALAELRSFAHDLIELVHHLSLLVDEQP